MNQDLAFAEVYAALDRAFLAPELVELEATPERMLALFACLLQRTQATAKSIGFSKEHVIQMLNSGWDSKPTPRALT